MPDPGDRRRRARLEAMFVVAAAVCAGALIAAFVSGGTDLVFVDSDGNTLVSTADGNEARVTTTAKPTTQPTTRRTTGSASTTTTSPTNDSSPPGSTTATETAPPPIAPSADPALAAAALQQRFEMCVANSGLDPGAFFGIQFAAEPGPSPNVFTATLTVPPPGVTATFTVDLAAGSIAPVDEVAGEFVMACPNLQGTG